jgi:DNA repair protein RadC
MLIRSNKQGGIMTISSWPVAERPREKLIQKGSKSLSDAELLAIFLRTGLPGLTALDLARHLLTRFGSLRALLHAGHRELCAEPGLGVAKYAQFQAALEIGRRVLAEQMHKGSGLTSPTDTRQYLISCLRDQKVEVFCCLFLDNRHRVLAFEELFRGTLNGAAVYPREVVKRALQHNAAAVIFAHNHPSGVAEPSQADEQLTQRLRDALALVEIRVLDHFVVGEDAPISFAERGLL